MPSVISASTNPAEHNNQWYEQNATKRGQDYLKDNLMPPSTTAYPSTTEYQFTTTYYDGL